MHKDPIEEGARLQQAGNIQAAISVYEHLLLKMPENPVLHYLLGTAYYQSNDHPERALFSLNKALGLDPTQAEAWFNRGLVEGALEDHEAALESFNMALRYRPQYPKACFHRGNTLHALNRFQEALESYDQAIAQAPEHADAHTNKGVTLRTLGRIDEALDAYARALTLSPNLTIRWNRSLLYLLKGDYLEGWKDYDLGLLTGHRKLAFSTKFPPWNGRDPIRGKRFLIHAEQGYGDVIQFARYAPLLSKGGASVSLLVPESLKQLMQTLPGHIHVLTSIDEVGQFDLHCPILSLPLLFRTTLQSIPENTPYLRTDPKKVAAWRQHLGTHQRTTSIGIVWSGNSDFQGDALRSMALSEFHRALPEGVRAIPLQKEIRHADRKQLAQLPNIHDVSSHLKDFSDTAALIDTLDLVITTCTSIAHLAGALGKEVWILLQYAPDWRWMLNRSDTPWYKSATLFRQTTPGDWHAPLMEIHQRLVERHYLAHR